MSGHSRWTQIKHKKGAADAKKGQLFSKLVREITVAARTGGPNPETNTRLRASIERARSLGLPKDNIERAVARATGSGEGTQLEEFLYEAIVPQGASILIEGISDNKNRTLAEIKKILADRGAKLAESGSLLWNFDKIGFIEVEKPEGSGAAPDETELAIIESGARDFKKIDMGWFVETEPALLESVRKGLEKNSFIIKASGHDYKAKTPLSILETERSAIESLIGELYEQDDVQEVYTNLKEA